MSRKSPMNRTRNAYILYYEVGLICSLLVVIVTLNIPLEPKPELPKPPTPEPPQVIDIPTVVVKQEIPKPAKPKTRIARPVEHVFVEVIDTSIPEPEYIPIDLPDFTTHSEPELQEQAPVLEGLLEKKPELIGGTQTLYDFINYPRQAREKRIEGKVHIEFILDENGNVTNPVVVKGIGHGCDQEALRAIKKVKFSPGIQNGRNVKVKMYQVVIFKLKK